MRVQRRANERRVATRDSEECRAELIREGIEVRDFQALHDAEGHPRLLASKGREGASRSQLWESEVGLERDEDVVRGRQQSGGRSS